MSLEPVRVVIRGPHNSGRTTLAILFRQFLEENGYRDVKVQDVEPLPTEMKQPFVDRFARNRERPIRVTVVTDSSSDVGGEG